MRVISISENRIVFDNGDTIKVSSEEGNVSHALDLRLFGNSLFEYEFTHHPQFGIIPFVLVMYHRGMFWITRCSNHNIQVYYNELMIRVENKKSIRNLMSFFDRNELIEDSTLDCFKLIQRRMNILKNRILPCIHKDFLEALRNYKQYRWYLMSYIHEYKECRKKIKRINNEIKMVQLYRATQITLESQEIDEDEDEYVDVHNIYGDYEDYDD